MCVTASCVSERCAAILREIIKQFVPPNVYIINDYQLSSRAAGRPGGAGGGELNKRSIWNGLGARTARESTVSVPVAVRQELVELPRLPPIYYITVVCEL